MYYRRFYKPAIVKAHNLRQLTNSQYMYLLDMYESNKFIICDQNSLDIFTNVIPEVFIEKNDKGFYEVTVQTWPHLKNMCLKFAQSNPLKWKYVSESDESDLFYYDAQDYLVFDPATTSKNNTIDSSAHRIH